MKNPFKKLNLVDTATNLLIGAGANVAMDYAVENIDALAGIKEYANWIKVGVGTIAGAMVSNKLVRQAADGLATVGASQLVKSYITPEAVTETTAGLPKGMIGRVRMGQPAFRRARKVAGVSGSVQNFMDK